MKTTIPLFLLALALSYTPLAMAQEDTKYIKSITVEGGPIATEHFQSEDEDFRETHGLGIVKVHTQGYGNWGLYFLSRIVLMIHL